MAPRPPSAAPSPESMGARRPPGGRTRAAAKRRDTAHIEKKANMTVILTRRADINLDTTHRVAWLRENVRIADPALQRLAACRASFLRLIASGSGPSHHGVTPATCERASHPLAAEPP